MYKLTVTQEQLCYLRAIVNTRLVEAIETLKVLREAEAETEEEEEGRSRLFEGGAVCYTCNYAWQAVVEYVGEPPALLKCPKCHNVTGRLE
jgi:hypothetical protein